MLCLMLSLTMAVPVFSMGMEENENVSPDTTISEIVAADCDHSWNEGSVTEPDCTATGILVKICPLCNETKEEVIPALGHAFDSLEKGDQSGHKAVCSRCGEKESQTHTWDSGSVTKEPTCTAAGEKTFVCPCGETKKETIPASGHEYGPWENTEKTHSRKCRNCTEKESGNHSWKEEIVKEATCKEAGSIKKTCSECGYSISVVTEKLKEHTYENVCDPDCDVCGAKRNVSHKYGNSWSRDSTGHWHECTKCGEKTDFKKHYPGPAATEKEAQICVTCDYVIQERLDHTHDFENKWSEDETGHWHACEGCDEEKDFSKHVYDNDCDDDCNICEYKREDSHSVENTWQTNEKTHWKACTLCAEKLELDSHVPGPEATEDSPQLCTVCGYELAPAAEHSHDFSSVWMKDAQSHWKECACGEKSVPFSHIWDDGQKGSKNSVIYTCTDCGEERMEVSSGFPWWIPVLLIILVLGAGAVAYFLIVLPKQQTGKFSRE